MNALSNVLIFLAKTIISFESDNSFPANPEVSTYESGEPKVHVYQFSQWTPDRMEKSLKIVRVGRTTAQNYRGDILRKPAYEVIEISLDDGTEPGSLDSGLKKNCAIDVCPVTANLAVGKSMIDVPGQVK